MDELGSLEDYVSSRKRVKLEGGKENAPGGALAADAAGRTPAAKRRKNETFVTPEELAASPELKAAAEPRDSQPLEPSLVVAPEAARGGAAAEAAGEVIDADAWVGAPAADVFSPEAASDEVLVKVEALCRAEEAATDRAAAERLYEARVWPDATRAPALEGAWTVLRASGVVADAAGFEPSAARSASTWTWPSASARPLWATAAATTATAPPRRRRRGAARGDAVAVDLKTRGLCLPPRARRAGHEALRTCDGLLDALETEGTRGPAVDAAVRGLAVTLTDYQIETVTWLVARETGASQPRALADVKTAFVRDSAVLGATHRGGILAEEMGLGKSIEVMALALLHPAPEAWASRDALKATLACAHVRAPNRWCVTGTPFGNGLFDVFGQLTFLGLVPRVLPVNYFRCILSNNFPSAYNSTAEIVCSMLKPLVVRHSKSSERDGARLSIRVAFPDREDADADAACVASQDLQTFRRALDEGLVQRGGERRCVCCLKPCAGLAPRAARTCGHLNCGQCVEDLFAGAKSTSDTPEGVAHEVPEDERLADDVVRERPYSTSAARYPRTSTATGAAAGPRSGPRGRGRRRGGARRSRAADVFPGGGFGDDATIRVLRSKHTVASVPCPACGIRFAAEDVLDLGPDVLEVPNQGRWHPSVRNFVLDHRRRARDRNRAPPAPEPPADASLADAKVAKVVELLAGRDAPALVFCASYDSVARVARGLEAAGVAVASFTGATPRPKRERAVAALQAGRVAALVATLGAGGVGLNLTAAALVVFFEPCLDASAYKQAVGRAHRLGQTREVRVAVLAVEGTHEETALALLDARLPPRDLGNGLEQDQAKLKLHALADATLSQF
ncbi:helicase [Aureococcus anophagefferens]|nr:helicase [Aureococcus anophagefferens]